MLTYAISVTGAVVTIVLYVFTIRNNVAKSKGDAIAKFRAAFAEEFTQLDSQDVHSLMCKAKVKHDVAIHEFRQFVEQKNLNDFDATVKRFDQLRSEVTPALLAHMKSRACDKPIDNSDKTRLKEAINDLLLFAANTQ